MNAEVMLLPEHGLYYHHCTLSHTNRILVTSLPASETALPIKD